MKQILPHNVLLFIALAATGAILLYNTVIRESYATTLRYAYPAVEQQAEATEPSTAKEVSLGETRETSAKETEPETEAEAGPATVTDEETVAGVQFPLDVNTATVEEILLIPDVTSAVAQRIVQYREQLGGAYTDLAELRNISGVGEATYEKLWAHFYISENGEPYGES